MTTDRQICVTDGQGLRLLGAPGQRSLEMITDVIHRELGAAPAALFAEPIATTNGLGTAWFTSDAEQAEPISLVAEDIASQVKADLAEYIQQINALADRSEGSGEGKLAAALRNALEVPTEDCLYAVQGVDGTWRPLLVEWARQSTTETDAVGVHTGLTAAAPKSAITTVIAPELIAVPPPAAPIIACTIPWLSWLWWLAWLLFALLLAWIAMLLIAPCGVRFLSPVSFCPTPQVIPAVFDDSETAALEERLRELERALAGTEANCLPLPPPPPPPPKPTPKPAPEPEPKPEPELDEFEERLKEQGAGTGNLRISLKWDDINDLDLWVTCPNGVEVGYTPLTTPACGAVRDVDANGGRAWQDSSLLTARPVENLTFNDSPFGTYRIRVNLCCGRSTIRAPQTRHPFTIRIKIGDRVRDVDGSVSPRNPNWIFTFEYGGE